MKCLLTILLSTSVFFKVVAQDNDIFDELDQITTKSNDETIATFKSTRVLLGQSTERVRKKQLHFRVSHVFSKIVGISNFFGLDNLNNMHFSFEYGVTNHVQLGISRSNKPDKTYSGTIKLSLFRQKSGTRSFPLSITYNGGVDYKSREYTPQKRDEYLEGRFDYINQLLISRKLGEKFSFLIAPIWVHINLTDAFEDPNDIYSVGIGGRYLVSRSLSINAEYYYTIPSFDTHSSKKDTLSVGFDVETGGHVFQLFFTNAFALHPGKFAINQSGDFFKRDINFGFSLLRIF